MTGRYRWGNLISCEPSRFIDEIDEKYMTDLTHQAVKPSSQDRSNNWSGFGRRGSEPAPNYTTRASNFKKLSSVQAATAVTSGEPFEADDPQTIEVGMEVEHQKFGVGKVMLMEGRSPDLKATVAFPGHGNKQLLLKFAKLKIIR